VTGGDRDVVEQAEAHAAVGLGVMAGRPHERVGVVDLPVEHRIDGRDRTARTEQRDRVRARPERRLAVAGVGAARRRPLDQPVEVPRSVHSQHLLARGGPGPQRRQPLEQPAGLY